MEKKLADISPEEKTEIINLAKQMGYKSAKRKMKTSKKLLYIYFSWVLVIQTYVLFMVAKLQDTVSLAIITGAVFTEAVILYVGYLRYQYGINLKSMEINYDPNYDENRGVY